MRILLTVAVMTAALAVPVSPAAALDDDVQKYRRAVAELSSRQVTPELIRLYEAAVKAMDDKGVGFGRNSNFAGLRPPELAWEECIQPPAPPARQRATQ